MTLAEMLQERAKVFDSIKALQDKYTDGNVMDSADKDTFANLEKEFDSLTEKIEAKKKADERERKMAEIGDAAGKAKDKKTENFFAMALSGRAEAIERYCNSYSLGTNATAGYLTAPVEFVSELIKGLDDEVVMRRLARNVGTLGNAQSLGFPYRATEAVDADWTTEVGNTSEETTLTYGRKEFKPYRLTKMIKISRTLMNHSDMAERTLLDEIMYRVGTAQENAYMTGDGSNKPLGIFTASNNGISTSRDVSEGNTATAVTMDGLLSAKYGVKGQYHRNAQWVMHRDLVKMVAKLKDSEGQYIWQPSTQAGQPDMLLGAPVNMSEFAPNTFTTGKYVAVYGDFRYYWILDGDALNMQILDQLYATNNQIGYLVDYFGDGMPVLGEAFARVKLA